jgi:2-polyprenyl-6-hydroxyphenyl methylase/3-demethylubiquinone-9 3-methyltransferase
MDSAEAEVRQGKRFTFGRNWSSFLKTVDEARIQIATESLRVLLNADDLTGRRFLDVGCGSGLFSLAARRLGAQVHSFDFDAASVACAMELRRRYDPRPENWTIEQGSILNLEFTRGLGAFDAVYAWGVLHHTGHMWEAVKIAAGLVRPQGKFVVALYNDQGLRSRGWLRVKQAYCAGSVGRWAVTAAFFPWFFLRTLGVCVVRGRNEFRHYWRHRGMSLTHDWVDWLGGLPFEVAAFEEVVDFVQKLGFELEKSQRTRRLGCNEFVFKRHGP